MKKRTNLFTLLLLLVSGLALQLKAQSVYQEQIKELENALEETFDPESRALLLGEIESIKQNERLAPAVERERKVLTFENQLNYFRGVMTESDEVAIVAMEHKNVDKALYGFLQTDFMHKYRSLKIEAESLAATFKAQALQLPPKDVARVKVAYTRVADDFNRFLVQIKRDFMDRKKLKVIKTSKELYANSLQYQLRELQDSYSQDFERVVAEVTGSDMYAAIPLASILGLIKLAKDFTEYLIRAHYEARRVKEEHLNQFLIEPYSFRSWFEIEMLEGDIYNTFDNSNEMYSDQEESWEEDMDPFVDDAPSLSRKKS
ncbi:MAG: hypothetical protein HKN87_05375 [Saprospiraceae bacterium]|nr:hypothetical protein [Saprospiraceae bacterium]